MIARLAEHERQTSNQVAVATVETLEGRPIEDAAIEILRETALGQADRNNGVLLLVAVAERRMRIEVGYGLEGALPDATAGRIIAHEIAPRFKAGDMPGGIEAGVDAIIAAIAGEYVARPEDSEEEPAWIPFAMVILSAIIVVFIIRRRRARRAAMGGVLLGGWGAHRHGGGFGGGGIGGGGFGGGGFAGGGGSGGGGGASGGW